MAGDKSRLDTEVRAADEATGLVTTAPADPARNGCACGAGPHPVLAGRCAKGHPKAGHGGELSRRHGLRTSDLQEVVAAERQRFLDQSIADDGGEVEVPERRRSLHVYRARLHVHIEQLSDAIERYGLFDRRQRLRALWLQRLEGLVARAQAIDQTLGLSRRTKRLPTLEDYLHERSETES